VIETIYIGLGSNQGDREENLLSAVDALGRIDAVAVLRRSALYESAPVGPPQPRYLNGVVELECGLSAQRLLGILKHIESDLGRTRTARRWGPRPIDLDVLLWGTQVVADANLQVPHLELHRRRFVLEPLSELCPELCHPVLGIPVERMLRQLEPQDVRRWDAEHWQPSILDLDLREEAG
jgi:2-amino-4-hydroxy-6-hydroxymethyldihydropteridine diphosphokinase